MLRIQESDAASIAPCRRDALLALASAPLALDAPAGVDARDSETFEQIRAAIDALGTVTADRIDWDIVYTQCVDYLRKESKDLLVAAYACYALLRSAGPAGLLDGLAMLRTLLVGFPDSVHPRRPRRRAAAIEWLAQRAAAHLGAGQCSDASARLLAEVVDAVTEIDRVLLTDARLGMGSATLGVLAKQLRDACERAQANTSAAPVAAPPTPAREPALAPREDIDLSSTQGVRKLMGLHGDAVRRLAKALRTLRPHDPAGYRLLRAWCWAPIEQLPAHTDGKTTLAGIPKDRLAGLETMLANGRFDEVIDEVETRLASAPLWLDAHRLTASALNALGHTLAARAVRADVTMLVDRFAELPQLKFNDGSAFADAHTRSWLSDIDTPALCEPQAVPAEPARVDGDPPWLDALREARRVAARGQIAEAVRTLDRGRRAAAHGMAEFAWRLALLTLLVEQDQFPGALAQLAVLEPTIEAHDLEQWDPEQTLHAARLAVRVEARLPARSPLRQAYAELLERATTRIHRLDPAALFEQRLATR